VPEDGLRYTSAVRIEVNGEPRDVKDGTTVRGLLDELGLGTTLVAVERNEEIVPRAEHATCALAAGDRIEVVEFVGGG
jgi:sulfur carrier protein